MRLSSCAVLPPQRVSPANCCGPCGLPGEGAAGRGSPLSSRLCRVSPSSHRHAFDSVEPGSAGQGPGPPQSPLALTGRFCPWRGPVLTVLREALWWEPVSRRGGCAHASHRALCRAVRSSWNALSKQVFGTNDLKQAELSRCFGVGPRRPGSAERRPTSTHTL